LTRTDESHLPWFFDEAKFLHHPPNPPAKYHGLLKGSIIRISFPTMHLDSSKPLQSKYFVKEFGGFHATWQ
jgi:hypothetical protein